MKQPEILRTLGKYLLSTLGFFVALLLLFGIFVNSVEDLKDSKRSSAYQIAHALGLGLYSYAQDHQGHYPVGKSSTEVFQQLIDGGYVTDPKIFYFAMPGKTIASSNKLTSENVSWDVTAGADSSSPAGLPILFLTGYQITYKAAASAEPLIPRTWFRRILVGKPSFIAVYDMDNSTKDMTGIDDGSIPNFISADFDPKGKTYRQLTP